MTPARRLASLEVRLDGLERAADRRGGAERARQELLAASIDLSTLSADQLRRLEALAAAWPPAQDIPFDVVRAVL